MVYHPRLPRQAQDTHKESSNAQGPAVRIPQNFGVFNKMFTSVHGPSWPNHNFAQSATSCGTSSNVMYNDCGGDTVQMPQLTIYDSLHAANVPFAIFVNDTCGAVQEQKRNLNLKFFR